jgi:phage FluMu protein Com
MHDITPARRSPRVFKPGTCADCQVSFARASTKQVRCPDCQEVRAAIVAHEAHLRKLAKRKADRAAARLARPGCTECGAPLRRNNSIGRCQEHRYIGEGMGACAHCGKPIRRDNQSGYCEEHKYATSRAPARFCASARGCDRQLRVDNTCGYCPEHFAESPLIRVYKDRQNARQRELTRLRPDERAECSQEGCHNRLRSDNTLGRCTAEHRYIPLELPECTVGGCDNRMTTTNTLGRCIEHRGEYWAPDARKCAKGGCGKTINADNMIGFCREHRYLSPSRKEYNREYYRDTQAARLEYARLYRAVYVEEHRENARRWARENPGLRSAARMRRRMRAEEGLTDLERLLSLARCIEMTGDPCFYCGAPSEEVEHYFPLCKGGTDAWANILPACAACNHGVGGKHSMCGTAFMLGKGTWKPFLPPEPVLNQPVPTLT